MNKFSIQLFLGCVSVLVASAALAESADQRVAGHVFSMSCKVTACNRELSTPEGKKRCVDWCRENGITKLWLESYRHTERVRTDLLVAERDYFRGEGFAVAGMITPTQLNDAPQGQKPPMVVCWSDPVARQRLREEVVRVAPLFDTVIVDDFLFSSCGETCPRCRADKARRGIADWDAYRRELMYEVARDEIVNPAKTANPKGRFIIKYPCLWRDWEQKGYSPKREAELFGSCWVGTETRDACKEPFQACWIFGHIQQLTDGRCGGGWYDALDSTPEKFVEQAYYTILSGAKESFIHCYDYLLAADPGVTPFGEKSDRSHACARLFEKKSAELRKLADFVSLCEVGPSHMQPNGVSIHLFYKDGKTYRARLNTKNEFVDGLAPHGFEFPKTAFAAVGPWDVDVSDFPRKPGETGDSARILRAVESAGKGGVVWFPRGEYEVDAMLVISNQTSLLLHKSAHLKAVREMPFVLKYFGRELENNGHVGGVADHNLFIKGGDIDGMGLANCAHVMGLRHFTMADTTYRNGRKVGLQLGDPNLPRSIEGGYEIIANNLYFICNLPGLAGNVGFLTYIGDSHFTDMVVVDYTVGIRDMKFSNRFTRCHIWGGIVKKVGTQDPEYLPNSIAFDLHGGDAVLTDCYADTSMIGFNVCSDTRIFNCGYFNNWKFKMDDPTVFVHHGGSLIVTGGRFSKNSPHATLYKRGEKPGRLIWRDNQPINFLDHEMKDLSE